VGGVLWGAAGPPPPPRLSDPVREASEIHVLQALTGG
jgi:hypothetical protein